MRSSGSRHTVFAPLALALLVGFPSACVSSVDFADDCEAAPSCGLDAEVQACPADVTCYEVSECGTTLLCAPVADQCEAYPTCTGGDEEVAVCPDDGNCYEAEMCGSVITCHSLVQCGAYPSCDPDDIDVTDQGCPLDASCYENSICGGTIICQDVGLPHGCPQLEPTEGELCESEQQLGVECTYEDGEGCFSVLACDGGGDVPPHWEAIAGGCELGGGT